MVHAAPNQSSSHPSPMYHPHGTLNGSISPVLLPLQKPLLYCLQSLTALEMEFWGVEVKNGESLKVGPGANKILHISQAALGEVKKDKGSEPIYLYMNFKDQKFVLATLSHENFPQANLDVVLEKDSELSHSWKNGSVYFSGYKIEVDDAPTEYSDDDFEEEEEQPTLDILRGKPEQAKPDAEKAGAAKCGTAVKQVNFKEPSKDAKTKQDDDSSDEDEDDDEDEDMSSDEESSDDKSPMANGGDESAESSDEDDDSESSDDETPKKPESSKKRPVESAVKTPVADKKAKLSTPQKTADGKKGGGHIATPHPSKQAGKKPANSEQTKQQTPKSAGSHSCKTCNRSFTSETGLQSHTKAKHGTAA